MKKIFFILSTLLFSISLFAYRVEKIISFDSVIYVNKDSSLVVKEIIKVISQGRIIKRGIFRDFPTKYMNKGLKWNVDFDVMLVKKNGFSEPYHIENIKNGKRLYIGSKNIFLHPGTYTYEITYKTNRQLGFFDDFDELYYNITGNFWAFPIEKASATIILPKDAKTHILNVMAYTGKYGTKASDYSVKKLDNGNILFKTNRELKPKDGLTIAVSWERGYVTRPDKITKLKYILKDNQLIIKGLFFLIIVFLYYIFVWFRVGKDPSKGPIIPLYEPPPDLSPAAIRYIMNMGYDKKIFTCSIINIAVKGFLIINEKDDDYSIKKTDKKDPDKYLSAEELKIYRSLFSTNYKIELDSTNYSLFQKAVRKLKKSLKLSFEGKYFLSNIKYFVPGITLSILGIVITVLSSPISAAGSFMLIWLSVWTCGVFFLFSSVLSSWKQFFFKGKLKSFSQALFNTLFALPFLAGEIFGLFMLNKSTSISFVFFLVLIMFVNTLFYQWLKAPTMKGRRVMNKIEGFKLYLSVAEKDRMKRFNMISSRKNTPELFEKYLSFAIALEVENEWAKQFEGVLDSSMKGGEGYRTSWYNGSSITHFSAGALTGAVLSGFSSSIPSSAPGSSSGSSGGGFSGGGGGGGGGGGW